MPEGERYGQERALDEASKIKALVNAGRVSDYSEAEAQIERQPIERIQEFEKVSTPEELLSFLQHNVRYGFVGKNKKVYTHGDTEMGTDFQTEYRLQSPEELLESGHGVCWDTVEFERRWLTDHGYQPETYFMMFAKEGGTDLPTHTFVTFERDSKWYWFEHAFADQEGIHEYADREELIEDVRNKHYDYARRNRSATPEDFARLRVANYKQPGYGSSPEDFVSNIIEQNPQLVTEN